jgi:hypothetical protein
MSGELFPAGLFFAENMWLGIGFYFRRGAETPPYSDNGGRRSAPPYNCNGGRFCAGLENDRRGNRSLSSIVYRPSSIVQSQETKGKGGKERAK